MKNDLLPNFLNKKHFFILFSTILVLVALLFVIQIFVKHSIKKELLKTNNIQFENLEISLLKKSLTLKKPTIQYISSSDRHSLFMKIEEVSIEGIRWVDCLIGDKIGVDRIVIESPDIQFFFSSTKNPSDSSIHHSVPSLIYPEINIGQIILSNGSLNLFKNKEDTLSFLNIGSYNIHLDKIIKHKDEIGLNNIVGFFKDLQIDAGNELYGFSIQQIHVNKSDSLLSINNFRVKPKFGKTDFFKQLDFKKAMLDFNIPHVQILGLDVGQLFRKSIVARKMNLSELDLSILVNHNLSIEPGRYKPLPHEILANAPVNISLDSLCVTKSKLLFEAISLGKTEEGSLVFDPITAVFKNVTNNKKRINDSKIMEVEVSGHVNGAHEMKNNFWMDLDSEEYAFSYSGHIQDVPFAALNSYVKPCANVSFQEGIIKEMKFMVNADRYAANGKLEMEYDNLSVTVFKGKRERKLLSKVVNILFVKNENSQQDGGFKLGEIRVKRDESRSFFYYWWQAIESGIKSSIK